MSINYLTELVLASRSPSWLGGGGEGACILAGLLPWEVAGLFLEAQGHNPGGGPALGYNRNSLFMIKWEANLLIYWQQAAQTPDAFQQNCTCTGWKKHLSWSFLGSPGEKLLTWFHTLDKNLSLCTFAILLCTQRDKSIFAGLCFVCM